MIWNWWSTGVELPRKLLESWVKTQRFDLRDLRHSPIWTKDEQPLGAAPSW